MERWAQRDNNKIEVVVDLSTKIIMNWKRSEEEGKWRDPIKAQIIAESFN